MAIVENTGVRDACINCKALVVCDDLSVVCRLEDEGYMDLCPRNKGIVIQEKPVKPDSKTEVDEVTYEQYVNPKPGSLRHAKVQKVTLVKMDRFEGKVKTIFPEKFPVPIMCQEFCNTVHSCRLLHTGYDDLCPSHEKLGKLVNQLAARRPSKFDMKLASEQKQRMQYARSSISGIVPEVALAHERTEDNRFEAYSATNFLDAWDSPEQNHEIEYSMDTGMASSEKSQAAAVPSYLYRTFNKDHRMLLGFQTVKVERAYVDEDRKWVYYPPYGKFVLSTRKVIRTTRYLESAPVYKWVTLPTMRPIGCYLKPMKVIGSMTVVTRKERAFSADKRFLESQKRHNIDVLIAQDAIDSRKQVAVMATC